MTLASADRRALPPFWLPLLAGLPLGACLLVMALPLFGHGNATLSRTLYLSAFVLWLLPLTALQRALWRRGTPGWRIALVLLATTYAMALATRLLSVATQAMASDSLARLATPGVVEVPLLFRGLEGAWLVLVAYCAIHAVVTYYAALRQEQADHLEARSLARDAELRALRYQLQPHFMFNTLNAVSTLVAEGHGTEARQMLARLSDFLRTVLDARPRHEVTLAEEIAMTEAYLEVEKARLGRRLQLQWQLGEGVLAAYVPYLLLQPLVENAIRHGIAPRRAPGRLDLRIVRDGTRLELHLFNDLPETGDVPRSPAAAREAVGLANVRGRLAHLYAGDATLHAGIEGERYHVRLTLPLRLQPEAAA
ncbi:histidine kinase [Pseudoxanthomonas sp.]|uniref:sensor histidine kinase n=1 Tax=Pseudoxanthomonas sp. TaxID=1871049 RepID=UPI0028C4EF0A|nr:histidine kinase [Pseudoxanthomonas sp.]